MSSDTTRPGKAICVTDYGAQGDGTTLDTAAIQKAIDDCSRAGGGTVVIPSGIFVTGTIWLRDNTELHLDNGAVLRSSDDIGDYNADDAFPQNAICEAEGWRGAHLILAVNVNNVALTGMGTVDGRCDSFMERTPTPWLRHSYAWAQGYRRTDRTKVPLRPGQMVMFCECSHVRIADVTLRNSCCWSCFIHGCENVNITGVRIDNEPTVINADGIDIDSSSNVTVSNCNVRTADDAITVRGNPCRLTDRERVCENIAITNCVLDSSVCSFRIGVGDGTIRNVAISNIVITRAATAFLIQSSYWKEGPGVAISDLSIHNIQARDLACPLQIMAGTEYATSPVENIFIAGFHGQCFGNITISGNGHTRPRNIALRDFDLEIVGSPHPEKLLPEAAPRNFLDISRADGIQLDDVRIRWNGQEEEFEKALAMRDVTDLSILGACALPDPGRGADKAGEII